MGNIFNRIFLALNGMALGIFCTTVLGTIISQLGILFGGRIQDQLVLAGTMLTGITGAGIGCSIAAKRKEETLVIISAAISGMAGALSDQILAGDNFNFSGSMNLLAAFIAAYLATEAGHFLTRKTKMDLILVPAGSILAGAASGILVSPFCRKAVGYMVELIHWATEQNTLLMGAAVAALMGLLMVLPVHTAALASVLSLTGEAAGAATIGCCACMVGFAAAGYRDNGAGGFLAQGLGSGILQFPNVIKKPLILLPVLLTAAILGAVGTLDWFQMINSKTGAVMGSSGLNGPFMTYKSMAGEGETVLLIAKIAALHFILPGILSCGIAGFMRKNRWIKNGDMKINV